jgi:hypothetical protein
MCMEGEMPGEVDLLNVTSLDGYTEDGHGPATLYFLNLTIDS